ncbi:MAG: 3-hydroxyacyl-CoA dehydrogenase NAD-binding domain-containing protein [Candidatus Njordarchaeales archaeon]
MSMLEAKVQNILKNIYQRSLCLAVIGSGYVGLPTAALFADTGFHVIAVDIKPEIVKAVNDGFSPINEPELDELVLRNVQAGRLRATSSLEALTQVDAVIVSVQTPIDQNKKPNLSFLMKAIEDI